MQRRLLTLAASLAIVSSFIPVHAGAAPSGLAWDSVTKLVTTGDASSLQPGSFDTDWAAASTFKPPDQKGVPGFLKAQMGAANAAMQLMKTGVALKHYVAGTKERVDDVAAQTATIIDCSAKTITSLDLKNKTYRVRPFGQQQGGTGGSAQPEPAPTDDGTRLAIDVKNEALGSKEVGGQPTTGYRSDTTFTETKPSGNSTTTHANLLAYYSSYNQPPTTCGRMMAEQRNGASMAQVGSMYERLTSALSMAGLDKRISVTQSGPHLPVGKLSMYTTASFQGEGGQAATFLSEAANVRSVDATDPVFSAPSDFTEQK